MATIAPPLLVTWDNSWLIGVRDVDAQHRNLVDLLNQLYQGMSRGQGKDVMSGVLASLISYTKAHFAAEERLMEQNGYPDIAAHKRQHVLLTERVMEFQREFNAGAGGMSIDLLEFLKGWLQGHIRGTDTKYVPFLHAKGVR